LYKKVLEVPIVVEATMEEHVLNIDEVINDFQANIEGLQLEIIPRMPLEV